MIAHSFIIQATEPAQDKSGKPYKNNVRCGVIALDAEDAMRAFKLAHPDATVWTTSHQGRVDVISKQALPNPTAFRTAVQRLHHTIDNQVRLGCETLASDVSPADREKLQECVRYGSEVRDRLEQILDMPE